MRSFAPKPNSTVNIDVTSSSQNVLVDNDLSAPRMQLRVMNNGTAAVWITIGIDANVTATRETSTPIGPGGTEVFSVPSSPEKPTYVAAIAAGSTGKVYFTPGSGM